MGLGRIRREVQIGEQDLALAQACAFDRLRFLHLHDHVGLGKDLFGGIRDPRPGIHIVLIGKARTRARAGFDQHAMAMGHRLARRVGRHADAVFLCLDFLRAADLHGVLPRAYPALICACCDEIGLIFLPGDVLYGCRKLR